VTLETSARGALSIAWFTAAATAASGSSGVEACVWQLGGG